MDQESKRIKDQRDRKLMDDGNPQAKDEVLNPTKEAMQTGRKDKTSENKATRNPQSYEAEFGSKKAGPGGYGDRADKPVTDRKRDQDAKERKESFDREASKKDKKDEKKDKSKAYEKETNKSRTASETKKHGDKSSTK